VPPYAKGKTQALPPWSVCVKDEGPGIPPALAPLLFEQFVRLPRDLSGPTPGTGLGLYISRQLVEAMGGRIWIESTGLPDQGSCFCFALPQADKARPKTLQRVDSEWR